jgi:hypothetical protein
VSIVYRIWAVRSKDRGLIPARARETVLLSTASILALKPLMVLSNEHQNLILQMCSTRRVMLTIPLHLVPRLGKLEA